MITNQNRPSPLWLAPRPAGVQRRPHEFSKHPSQRMSPGVPLQANRCPASQVSFSRGLYPWIIITATSKGTRRLRSQAVVTGMGRSSGRHVKRALVLWEPCLRVQVNTVRLGCKYCGLATTAMHDHAYRPLPVYPIPPNALASCTPTPTPSAVVVWSVFVAVSSTGVAMLPGRPLMIARRSLRARAMLNVLSIRSITASPSRACAESGFGTSSSPLQLEKAVDRSEVTTCEWCSLTY